MNNRLFIDPQAFSLEASRWLDQLSQQAEGLHTRRFSEILGKWRQLINERVDAPFTVVVCGEFKRGKSSLINAVLNEDITPVDVIPETVTYNTISWGPHANEAVLSGGRRLRLSDDELKRENLERVIAETGCKIEQLVLKRPIEALRDIAIVDTPGLNDIIDLNSALLKRTLSAADAIVYVMTPSSPLSMTEQSFLRSLIQSNPTLPIMIVANKVDLMPLDQLGRIEEAIMRRLQRFLPGQTLYFLSAYAERCRQTGRQLADPEDTETLNMLFDDFRGALLNELSASKDVVLLNRVEQLVTNCVAELEEEIGIIRAATDARQDAEMADMQRMADALKDGETTMTRFIQDMNVRIDVMEQGTKNAMADLFLHLRREIDVLDAFDEADIERYYPFYCVDMVQEELTAQLEQNQDEICHMIQTTPELEFLQLPNLSVPDMRFDLDTRLWTKGDTVGFFGDFAPGMFSQLLVTYAGGLMREKEIAGQTISLKEKILEKFPVFREDVLQNIHEFYQQFRKDMGSQISNYLSDRQAQLVEREREIEKLRCLSDERKREIEALADQFQQKIEAMKGEMMGKLKGI